MLKNLIILPDDTEVSSGTSFSIKTSKLTSTVNDGAELSLGSACPQMLEATLFDVGAKLSLTAGDEVVLYKVDDDGARTKKGVFILEKPTRPSANTLKLTAYDRITKLDKDLTAWLKGLTGWPYGLLTFARMVCSACGLTLVTTEIPNSDFPVYRPAKPTATGRQLMKWIGEICCRFCRANADGDIEFAWYKPSGVTVGPSGNRHYFQGGLTYETYQVAPIEAVQMRLADSESGALWPKVDDGANSYVITGNAILMARVTEELLPYFRVMEEQLAGITYTPCKVAIPSCLDVDAGSILDVTDKNGNTITTYVMSKTTSGQRDTLECTGSHRRDSTTPANVQSVAELDKKLDMAELFNRLTQNGLLKGLYMEDGELCVNASYIKTGELIADLIKSGTLDASVVNIENLTADMIKSGVISSIDGAMSINLNNGYIIVGDVDSDLRMQLADANLLFKKKDADWSLATLMHYSDTEETYFGMGGGTGHAFSVYASASGAYISLTHPEVGATGHTACWRKIFGIPMITTPDAKPALAPADIGAFPGFVRILTSADDMDDIKDDGIYVYSTSSVPANAPFANAAVVMVFGADSTTTQKIQLGIRYGEGGHFKFRALYSSSWHAWAEVLNSVNGPYELLWENASKTSSFAEQTISVDTSGYDHLLVVCSYNRSPATGQTTIPVWLRDKGDGDTSACLAVDYITSSGVITRPFRKMTVKAGRTQIVFGGGCKYDGTASDENAIPYYIYGLKGVHNP